MTDEKKLWLCEQYAQKAWTLSLVLSQEAARAGAHGRGYAVIAHESRRFADKLFEYAASVRFDRNGEDFTQFKHNDVDFKGIDDFAVELKFLAANAAIEIIRVAQKHMEFNIPKSMSVFAEELRRLAININELAEEKAWEKPFTLPEPANPSGSNTYGNFFRYSIGGVDFIENVGLVTELFYLRGDAVEGETLSVRKNELPIINFYRRLGLPRLGKDKRRQTFMIVCPDGNPHGERYAVPIDDLDIFAIVEMRIGTAVPPQKGHAFAEFARECWDAVGGGQLMFIDWRKVIK